MIVDAEAREAALAPDESCIVEAPAGSGKTELLTRRFLRLLATVDLPEQIVAITFTRKAAAEMRQRVVETLAAAEEGNPALPNHRLESVALARLALRRSRALGWSLPEQSQRLRILTIDALNANLARQLPVLANGVVGADVTDEADWLYRRAARRTTEDLADAGALGRGLRTLLAAAGNSLAQLESWLASTLPQRDRWLRLLAQGPAWDLPAAVLSSLARLGEAQLRAIDRLVGAGLERRITALLEGRRQHLAGKLDGPGASADVPGAAGAALRKWREAAALLLTRSGSVRRRFTRREGIPADAAALREDLDAVLAAVRASERLRETLAGISRLPDLTLDDEQRVLLGALAPVLRRLLAELRIVFAETQTVDHTELAIAALQALGAVDEPSDLLLALDRRIEHILVDEFQDTSHLQWTLLETLTAGWQPGDGRSLFLVGDPMQSIYRFRDAELSLFLKAKRDGIGGLHLRPVHLAVNYRSSPALVDWVNSTFSSIFGEDDRLDAGLPAYRPAAAGRPSTPEAGVHLHDLSGGGYADEIARVVDLVRQESEARPTTSIAILVRSRSHVIGMRAALAAAGVPAHAIEIDSLTDTQLGLDLIALSSALLHEGDRLAWLAVLRGPCCGIGWSDLHALCANDSERTIWSLLSDGNCLKRLSPGGQARAIWLRDRLEQGRSRRSQLPLGRWIRDCWQLLDGPAALEHVADLELAERYFSDLEQMAAQGDVDDPARLRDRFARPAGGEIPAESGVEIMTIHRAKGLEFDTVILPALGKITRRSRDNLLLLQDIVLADNERLSLIAATGSRPDGLFAYLKGVEREQESAERARLMYVAATRARERLHLVGALAGQNAAARSGSLLETLWPAIEWPAGGAARAGDAGGDDEPDRSAVGEPAAIAESSRLIESRLRRLIFDPGVPLPALAPDRFGAARSLRPQFEWVHPASVQVGTLIHRELQRWADRAAVDGWLREPAASPARYRRELALLGVETEDLDAAAARVSEALRSVWNDPVGRWILQPRDEAWSELRLSCRSPSGIEHLRIDRSFVADDGQRWIIDYKTGRHLGADIERFLDSEVDRYRAQLEGYARALAAIDQRPIRVGLYFPLLARLKDWQPPAMARS